MKCIYCLHKKTEVSNSRAIQGGTATWRRRACPRCNKIFTTKETSTSDNLFVIKRNKIRQRLVYEKLFISIFTVLSMKKGSDNGDNATMAKNIAHTVIKQICALPNSSKNVHTSTIILLVYKELKKHAQSYAEHFISYSSYRREVAKKAGVGR